MRDAALHEPADARDALRRAREVSDTPQLGCLSPMPTSSSETLPLRERCWKRRRRRRMGCSPPRLGTYWSERDRGMGAGRLAPSSPAGQELQAEVTTSIEQVDPVLAERFLRSLVGTGRSERAPDRRAVLQGFQSVPVQIAERHSDSWLDAHVACTGVEVFADARPPGRPCPRRRLRRRSGRCRCPRVLFRQALRGQLFR